MLAVLSNLIFSRTLFRSIPFRSSEWDIPRHTEFREISTFFRGITKTVPSLFHGFFSEWNFDGNPTLDTAVWDFHFIKKDHNLYTLLYSMYVYIIISDFSTDGERTIHSFGENPPLDFSRKTFQMLERKIKQV
jgi:hypothetical protein